jgi:hypothetical protein
MVPVLGILGEVVAFAISETCGISVGIFVARAFGQWLQLKD